MWEDFHEAFVHGQHKVLGRKLKPYCSRYLFWLKVLKSPLITGGMVTLPDLEAAVRICSSDFDGIQQAIAPKWFDKPRFLWRAVRYSLAEETDKFRAYADDFNSPPEPESRGSESTFAGEHLPHEIFIVSGLISLGLSPQEAWMTPLGEAEWYLSVSNIHRGKESNILMGHDREFIAGMKAQRERKKKEAENGKGQ